MVRCTQLIVGLCRTQDTNGQLIVADSEMYTTYFWACVALRTTTFLQVSEILYIPANPEINSKSLTEKVAKATQTYRQNLMIEGRKITVINGDCLTQTSFYD